MNKYFKNFILCGDINQYCLLCKESFHLIPDIEKHIRWEKHRKIIKDQTCLTKFRKDSIYKIGSCYYCEICNLVTSNMASLKEHVKSEKHELLKNKPDAIIKKPAGLFDSGYVIINKVILNLAQWNSIVEGKCRLCCVNVNTIDDHISTQEHIIKLIQTETNYKDNLSYRKIDENTYHCFSCKKIFAADDFEPHLATCENTDEIEIKKLKEAKSSRNVEAMTGSVGKMDYLEKQLLVTLEDFYEMDEITNTAKCKHCPKLMSINFKSLIEHMKYQHDKTKQYTSSEESEEEPVIYRHVADNGLKRSRLARYGRSHYIKLNHNGGKGYCNVCDRFLSANLKLFKTHCKGIIHRGHLELRGIKKPRPRDPVNYNSLSIRSYTIDLRYSPEERVVWINGEFCVSVNSYYMIYVIQKNNHYKKTKCFACDLIISHGEERDHCLSTAHMNNFYDAQILMRSNEFVREVRPNLFHCGFCNLTVPFADALEKHLLTFKHNKSRTDLKQLTTIVPLWQDFNPLAMDPEELYIALLRYDYDYIRLPKKKETKKEKKEEKDKEKSTHCL
ncbi:uncharacterized protein LOC142983696 [Anticarsia gemmatalis]|uniref:uncharacterized protein LOC142983696 n=1 Tax=Anticarsia gemmatalis TaxID=129554 RepID=UPI003F760F7F